MNKKEKNKNHFLTFIIAGLVFILSLIQLFISHRLATTGEKVVELEVQASQIEQENVFLEEEISQIASLTTVSQKAQQLGFVRTSNILYLTSQIPVALGTSNVPFGR